MAQKDDDIISKINPAWSQTTNQPTNQPNTTNQPNNQPTNQPTAWLKNQPNRWVPPGPHPRHLLFQHLGLKNFPQNQGVGPTTHRIQWK